MIKFVITWCVISFVEYDPPEKLDQFGRVIPHVTLEYITVMRRDCDHSKTFFNKDSAFNFYNEALKEQANQNLDSVDMEISNRYE